jgi:hypothetical protein
VFSRKIEFFTKRKIFIKTHKTKNSQNKKMEQQLLVENFYMIDWTSSESIFIIRKIMNTPNWYWLSALVDWYLLSQNPNAIDIIEQNMDKVDWLGLSLNTNAIHLLEQNLDKVNWWNLSGNQNAIFILEQNLDKVNWLNLSRNPNATNILAKNLEKINWGILLEDPINYQNLEKAHWNNLSFDLNKHEQNIKKNTL